MGFFWRKKPQASKPILNLGQQGELWAIKEYEKKGYSLLAQNEFNKKGLRLGEIDFIVKLGKTLAFVEVKTRTLAVGRFGSGAEAVDHFKQLKLLKSVKLYLNRHPELLSLTPRIDVCVITVTNLDRGEYYVTMYENSVADWN